MQYRKPISIHQLPKNILYIYISLYIGGFHPSEKYSSVGVTIPNIWKNKNVPNHQPDINNIHIMVRLIF